MTQEQIEMLKKALDLYDFAISQREYPEEEENEFYWFREKLSEILGVDVGRKY